MYGQPPYGNNGTYNQQYNPQMYAQYPQKKTKGGIIALIIVLCSLLTIGFIGMMVYGFSVGIKKIQTAAEAIRAIRSDFRIKTAQHRLKPFPTHLRRVKPTMSLTTVTR